MEINRPKIEPFLASEEGVLGIPSGDCYTGKRIGSNKPPHMADV